MFENEEDIDLNERLEEIENEQGERAALEYRFDVFFYDDRQKAEENLRDNYESG